MINMESEDTTFASTFGKLGRAAIDNKKLLEDLKRICVQNQQYQIASELREIEVRLFPNRPERQEALDLAVKVDTLMRMGDIGIGDPKTTWIIYQMIQRYNKLGEDLTLMDAASVQAEANRLFD